MWPTSGGPEGHDFKDVVTRECSLKARRWTAVSPTVPLVVVEADGSERRAA